MEFEQNGATYKVGKLDARAQFHIVRRLAPVFGELVPALQDGKEGFDAIPAMARAIAGLSDSDADYCIFGLLAVISRKQEQGLGWTPVATGNSLMYAEVDMVGMLQLAWQSLQHNMAGFFAALPSDLAEAVQKVKDQSAG
jgi:hypothetical protein